MLYNIVNKNTEGAYMDILNYKIDVQTMYIKCIEERGYYSSKIYELEGEPVMITHSPNTLINTNCKLYSQSYISRKEMTKLLTGIITKPPIILDLFGVHTFFSTHSDRVTYNEWLNLRHIKSYDPYRGMTRVTFTNNEQVVIDISHRSFNNQYLNALKLNYMFTLEMNEFNKRKNTVRSAEFSIIEE